MLSKLVKPLALILGLLLFATGPAWSADPTLQELMQEIQALKAKVADLENKLAVTQETRTRDAEHGEDIKRSVKVSQEVSETGESALGQMLSEAGSKLTISGGVEVEGYWQKLKKNRGEDEDSSDITLATAELIIGAELNKYTRGVLHFLWEEGSTEPVDIDEGFIILGQTDDMPWYVMAGRIYPAVGLFESNFVSDPLTLELFETQDTAMEAGFDNGWINVGLGAYNAGIHQSADDPDSNLNTFYGRVQVSTPEDMLEGFSATAGMAYTNNIASSGFLSEQVPDERLEDLVGGWSAMATVNYLMFGLTAEYVTSLDEFNPGELEYAGDVNAKPWAFNLELSVTPFEQWTFAAKYEKASDVFEEFPEIRYGAVASWEFLPNTIFSLEYLRGEYQNDDTSDTVTSQLAVGF